MMETVLAQYFLNVFFGIPKYTLKSYLNYLYVNFMWQKTIIVQSIMKILKYSYTILWYCGIIEVIINLNKSIVNACPDIGAINSASYPTMPHHSNIAPVLRQYLDVAWVFLVKVKLCQKWSIQELLRKSEGLTYVGKIISFW